MLRRDDAFVTPKKLRFRGDLNLQHFHEIEDIFDDANRRDSRETHTETQNKPDKDEKSSLYDFLKIELTRGYVLEHDEERYSARREKIYSFMRIPRELEKFMAYGFLQCLDSFLYIYTFLPIRYVMALWGLILTLLRIRRQRQRLLTPAEMCDLLKGTIWLIVCFAMFRVFDTNMLYHLIKSQSIIKLYIFYNMLEVGDKLLSAFGQDTIDALFWTATEPKNRRSEHLGLIPHICFALFYVGLHSTLIMFQATTLNVAINSNNKGLLTIMMSNNFVEIKGSVFKKFDKNNLFQLTCSDVRERFHLVTLLVIVVIQTMKEFNWRTDQFLVMLPCCLWVLFTEFFVDWIKHAFVTRFNELPCDVYREYTISLAYDMAQTRQKHAFSDHSDLVARRMGFIPFPLGVVLLKALYHAVSIDNLLAAFIIFVMLYIFLISCRILNTICALGKACDLMTKHEEEKMERLPQTPAQKPPVKSLNTSDMATSPMHHQSNATPQPTTLHRSKSQIMETVSQEKDEKPNTSADSDIIRETCDLGATAIFSNSDVDLDDVKLNEKVLNTGDESAGTIDSEITRSVPDLQDGETPGSEENSISIGHRTHRRSESEPSIQIETVNVEK
ncbi:protein TAPT1 homolog [Culicoides brevitarsis]|uniref:protein TAPT1 homolog n=1 Tax=Culicoides brevitarsis TaxID=469753 RepID=UPI00307C08E0